MELLHSTHAINLCVSHNLVVNNIDNWTVFYANIL